MKKLLFTTFALMFLNFINAQTSKIVKSVPAKVSKMGGISSIIGSSGDGIYAMEYEQGLSGPHKAKLVKLDKKTLQPKWELNEFETVGQKEYKAIEFQKFSLIDNKVIIYYSGYNEENKTKEFGIMIVSSDKKISDVPAFEKIKFHVSPFDYYKSSYDICYSPDSSKVLIAIRSEIKKLVQTEIYVLDTQNNFSYIWNNALPENINNLPYISYNYQIDNESSVYFLACSRANKKDINKNLFVKISKSTKELQVFDINSPNGNIINGSFWEKYDKYTFSNFINSNLEVNYSISSPKDISIVAIARQGKESKTAKASIVKIILDKSNFKELNNSEINFDDKIESRFKELGYGNKGSASKDYNIAKVILLKNVTYIIGNMLYPNGSNNNGETLIEVYDQFCFKIEQDKIVNSYTIPRNYRSVGWSTGDCNFYLDKNSFYIIGTLPSKKDKSLKMDELDAGNYTELISGNPSTDSKSYIVIYKFSETGFEKGFIPLNNEINKIGENIIVDAQLLVITSSFNYTIAQTSKIAYNFIKFK